MSRNPEIDQVPPRGSGLRKAAILVLVVGDELANGIFTRLSEKEIRMLGQTAAKLKDVSRQEIYEVLRDFKMSFEGGHIPKIGAGSQFQLMVERALGEQRAHDLLSAHSSDDPFDICRRTDPVMLATVLENEHPQTIAIVLSALDADHAGSVLRQWDTQRNSDLVYRMAHLGSISEEVKRDVGKTLENILIAMNLEGAGQGVDAKQLTIDMVKKMPRTATDALVEHLERRDEGFARELRSKLFTFNDLSAIDPRGMQRLLREVDNLTLAKALKGASEELEAIVFASMSSRAADMLRDDIEAMGPTRLSEVEEAQRNVMAIAMRLEAEGVIAIPRGGEGELL